MVCVFSLDLVQNLAPGETWRFLRAAQEVKRALKEGMVRGQRMSMDTYLRFPVETRTDFLEMKHRYNPDSPARYPAFWDDYAKLLQERSYPVQLPLLSTDCQGFYSGLISPGDRCDTAFAFCYEI